MFQPLKIQRLLHCTGGVTADTRFWGRVEGVRRVLHLRDDLSPLAREFGENVDTQVEREILNTGSANGPDITRETTPCTPEAFPVRIPGPDNKLAEPVLDVVTCNGCRAKLSNTRKCEDTHRAAKLQRNSLHNREPCHKSRLDWLTDNLSKSGGGAD